MTEIERSLLFFIADAIAAVDIKDIPGVLSVIDGTNMSSRFITELDILRNSSDPRDAAQDMRCRLR